MTDIMNLVGMTDAERRRLALDIINPQPGQHNAWMATGGLWQRFNDLAARGFNLNAARTAAHCARCGKTYRATQYVFISRHAAMCGK